MSLPLPPAPGAPAPPPLLDEAARRASLQRMQLAATGLLVVALVVYVIAHLLEPAHPWLGYVRATAEASLVGGIADWFAVTALFRRPLGLPIPHTAIMQTQKDRVGRVLGNFVQNHFLSRTVLLARLRTIRPAARIGEWLATPGNADRLAHQAAGALASGVTAIPPDDARALIGSSAISKLERVRFAPVLGEVLGVVAAGPWPRELLDQVLALVSDATHDGRDAIRAKVREESPRWLPGALKDAVAERMTGGAERFLAEVRADPGHPMRQRFDAMLQDFIERLRTSPELQERAERMKRDLLGHEMVEQLAGSIWDRVREIAERYRNDPGATSLAPVVAALASAGESLRDEPGLQAEVDGFLADLAASFLEQHRHEVGELIAATVRDWDPEVAASRIELAVGRDLQFIRLNGTLVGGAAGLLIYTLSQWL